MSTEPYVSVIIPVYNSGPLLAETLQSVLSQTHNRLEIVVVDDGSTDRTTLETLHRHRSSIHLIQQPNQGVASARNTGLRSACGDYIAFIDQDDLWAPEKLEVQLALAAQHGESGMIVCDGVQFDGDRIISERLIDEPLALHLSSSASGVISGDFYAEVLECNPASCPAQTLMPRRVCERIGPITVNANEPEDWDYMLRIAALYPITLHRHPLVRWRYSPTSRSGPLERRRFVWALSSSHLLRRYVREKSQRDLALIHRKLDSLIRDTARACYRYGRQRDSNLKFARSYLDKLFRSNPSAFVLCCLIALYLPEKVLAPLFAAYGSTQGRKEIG